MIFYHVLSEAILYQGKLSDLNNTLINSQYIEKLVCQVFVLQSIVMNNLFHNLYAEAHMEGNFGHWTGLETKNIHSHTNEEDLLKLLNKVSISIIKDLYSLT